MILFITFSKPAKNCKEILGKPYTKIRITKNPHSQINKAKVQFNAELFTEKQVFHKTMTEEELNDFIKTHSGTTFKNVVQRTETEEITTLTNRHGKVKTLCKKIQTQDLNTKRMNGNVQKKYILQEGKPIPFLVKLGVMAENGKVIAQKYDKFRQINRFLEFIDDILPAVQRLSTGGKTFSKENPLRIADFGCGKSYLTFAVYYFLTELKKIPTEITGLDLKEDVIKECQNLAKEFGYNSLHFHIGNIADFSYTHKQDIIITLHACDVATDYALSYAINNGAKAILCVPCCQHEINTQLESVKQEEKNPFTSLLRYGIIKERFAALATDVIRSELLEQNGYSVQILEFIDMTHTPKNLLIRAVKKSFENEKSIADGKKIVLKSQERTNQLLLNLNVSQSLNELLKN